ncbi:MAG: hypothetical protein J6P98_07260, partial [Clostridia bacterium]|nr:hypothetical protein [Clostridia bacterium]
VDDEVRRIEFDNPHKAGYQFEMGRIHAQREAASVDARAQQMYYELGGRPAEAGRTEKRKRHTFWWVMGWIFIFPIPVTILCIRSKKMKLWLKIPLILAAWAFYLLLASGKLGGS